MHHRDCIWNLIAADERGNNRICYLLITYSPGGEDTGKSLVQVDAIYESLLINFCQARIYTPLSGQ